MNGEVCCIIGACCPLEERAAALAKEMCHDNDCALVSQPEQALEVARWLFKHFDLVPAGTGVPLVKAAAAVAVASHKRKGGKDGTD